MDDEKDKKIITSPYYSLEQLKKHSSLAKRGLRDLNILPEIQTLIVKMKEECFAGNFQECINLCDEILKSIPAYSEPLYKNEIFFYKCACLSYLNKYEEAIIWIDKALEYYPDDKEFFHLKANCFYSLSNYEEALKWYNKDSENYYEKATCLYSLGNYEESLKWYDKVIENWSGNIPTPNGFLGRVNMFYNKASCLYHLNRYEEALVWFDKALEKNPEYQLTGSLQEDCLEDKAVCLKMLGRKHV
ncbi:MAG: tetratricopeptide repeat protein [Candidatus Paceibacterota bacterium]|jgi:tetratricopeptide (TPR) repeat protein